MKIQIFYELIVDRVFIRSPSWFIHRDDIVTFLELEKKSLIFILKLLNWFSLNFSRMIFIVKYGGALRDPLAGLTVIKSRAVVRLAHFFVLSSFMPGDRESMWRWSTLSDIPGIILLLWFRRWELLLLPMRSAGPDLKWLNLACVSRLIERHKINKYLLNKTYLYQPQINEYLSPIIPIFLHKDTKTA